MRFCGLLLCLSVSLGVPTARADGPADLRALLAHPETPSIGLSFRGALRASIGLNVPIVDEDRHGGFGFHLPILVELFNGPGSDQGLPNENWRAYVGLDTTWRRRFGQKTLRRLELGATIQHQSDHHTGRDGGGLGQLQLNDLRLRSEVLLAVGEAGFVLAGEARVFAASCTLEYHCGTFLGSWAFGGALDVLFDLHAADEGYRGWSWFAAAHGGGIVPNGLVIPERRLILQTGARSSGRLGQWQLYGMVWLGNTVGINREERVVHVGGGFRWTP